MNFEITLVLLVCTFVLAPFALYKSKKPKQIGKGWTVPWMAIVFFCVIVLLVLINHLIALNSPDGKPLQRPINPTRGAIDAIVPSQDFVHLSQQSLSYSEYRVR